MNAEQKLLEKWRKLSLDKQQQMDALHIAAAISVGAEEFITTEKSTKPMYKVTDVNVVSLFD